MLDANYKQKSAGLTLIVLVIVFGNYFVRVWFFPSDTGTGVSGLIIALVIFVIIETLLHIGLGIGQKDEMRDERDINVAGKSYRNSHIVMISIIVYAVGYLLLFSVDSIMSAINMMVLTAVVGELVRQASLVFYYHKGI